MLRAILLTFRIARFPGHSTVLRVELVGLLDDRPMHLANVLWSNALWSNCALRPRVIQIAAVGEIWTDIDALLKVWVREFSRSKVLR